jgi:transketolase
VEHIQSLRLIPNLEVWRPADAIETAECWAASLRQDGPSVLCLSRQNLRPVRTEAAGENLSARGGYIVRDCADPKVILIATGSEVELALDVADELGRGDIAARVVSLPNWRRFEAQDEAYREGVLPTAAPEQVLRVSIEAGTTFGWERLTMVQGLRFGLDGFGASAPAKDLYDHFGLTAEKITPQIIARLSEFGHRSGSNAASDSGTLAEAEAHPS